MNVTVENLAPCKKLLRVELDVAAVDEAFKATTKEFQKEAALPGFRPGKAPEQLVAKKYDADITAEVKRKLIGDSYRKAVEEKKLDVLGYPDIEEIQFGRGQVLQFAATIETSPEFQLPEYKGLTVKRDGKTVTDDDVERAINLLRDQRVSYEPVAREAQNGDMAVVNYTGTCDGKPFTELAPTATGLTEQKNFWVEMRTDSFIPGFSEQLLGAKAGDKRTVTVDFPADFVAKELGGRKGVYEVEVVEVKEKILPPLDDTFAKSFEAESLEKLREGVRRDLENELKFSTSRDTRTQIMRELMGRVNFELPESAVARETRNVVYDLVNENAKRGVSREIIEKEKDSIYAAAASNAKDRVKLSFLIQKIAEQEDIKVAQEEILQRVQTMAAMYQIPAEKFVKDLQKRNGFVEIYDQLAHEKVMQFLENNAKVETAPAVADVNPG
ncbi:MAG: trigger factor [Pedosphaera sp.]|nr:trigger factor [Pedosphaera sp.]